MVDVNPFSERPSPHSNAAGCLADDRIFLFVCFYGLCVMRELIFLVFGPGTTDIREQAWLAESVKRQ
jgi:hypothetical protein